MNEEYIKELKDQTDKLLQQLEYYKSELELVALRNKKIRQKNQKLKREITDLKSTTDTEQRSFDYGDNK